MVSRLQNMKRFFVTSLIPLFERGPDDVDPNTKSAIALMNEDDRNKLTGKDRLYLMFSTDEFGELSPELSQVTHVAMMSIVVGGAVGGYVQSRHSFLNFLDQNDVTKFKHHIDAKQRLQDQVTIGFAKGAYRWAWRLTAFTTTYSLASSTLSVYRGKNGILEHTLAGTLAGAGYKLNLGIRGIVVGGCLGAVLGTCCGVFISGILKLTGKSMQDVRDVSYKLRRSRDISFEKGIKSGMDQNELPIILEYREKVGDKNTNLDSIKIEPESVKQ